MSAPRRARRAHQISIGIGKSVTEHDVGARRTDARQQRNEAELILHDELLVVRFMAKDWSQP
jgi:hypothetical protein